VKTHSALRQFYEVKKRNGEARLSKSGFRSYKLSYMPNGVDLKIYSSYDADKIPVAVIRSDNSILFRPLQMLKTNITNTKECQLLAWLTDNLVNLVRVTSVKYDTRLRFYPLISSPEYAAAVLEESKRHRIRVQFINSLTSQDWSQNKEKMNELWQNYKAAGAEVRRQFRKWVSTYGLPGNAVEVRPDGSFFIPEPVKRRTWTDKKAEYMKRRREWLSNIKLRVGVNSVDLKNREANFWFEAIQGIGTTLVAGNPTEQEDVRLFLEFVYDSKNGRVTDLSKEGANAVKRHAELLRVVMGAVVYS
jgi:hypothetical protein